MVRLWKMSAIALFGLAIGCTRAPDTNSQVTIQLPAASQEAMDKLYSANSQNSVGVLAAAPWDDGLNPALLSEVNCYGIFVSGPETFMKDNQCTTLDANVNYPVGMPHGLFPAGSNIVIPVPPGLDRKIMLVGFQANAGACVAGIGQLDNANLSRPHIIGSASKNLSPGPDEIEIVATLTTTNPFKVDECSGPDFGGSGSGTTPQPPAPYTVSVVDGLGWESSPASALTFTISPAAATDITATWVASGATDQISIPSGTFTISTGQTEFVVYPYPVENAIYEDTKYVQISVFAPGLFGGDTTGTLAIDDSADATTVSAFPVTISEAAGLSNAMVVTMSGVADFPITVNYSTSTGTATPNVDYVQIVGTTSDRITFAPGTTTATIPVSIIDDGLTETHETVGLYISALGAPYFGPFSVTLTIADDEVPLIQFGASPIPITEGNVANISVGISSPQGVNITIPYTVSGTATFPADHNVASGNVIITAGSTFSGLISLTAADDAIYENQETVIYTLGTPSGGFQLGATSVHTIQINDNDVMPTVYFSTSTFGNETGGGSTANFSLSLSAISGVPVVVTLSTSNGTATGGGIDYNSVSSEFTISAGSSSIAIGIPIIDDGLQESTETFTVSGTSAFGLANNPMTVSIYDDEFLNVLPVYSNSADWNHYVKFSNTGVSRFEQSDSVGNKCDGSEVQNPEYCLHGAEMQKVTLSPYYTNCTNLTMNDSLGAFDWKCDASSMPVKFYSYGLKSNKGLRDLINGVGNGFLNNSVTLYVLGSPVGTTTPSNWWPMTFFSQLNSSGSDINLNTAGMIYTVQSLITAPGISINNDRISLVTLPGGGIRYLAGSPNCSMTTGESGGGNICLVFAGNQKFLWIEANIDAYDGAADYAEYAGHFALTKFSVFRNSHFKDGMMGLNLAASDSNSIINSSANSNMYNLVIGLDGVSGSHRNLIRGFGVANGDTGATGIMVDDMSTNNRFIDFKVSNVGGKGLWILGSAVNNTFVNGLIFSTGAEGILVDASAGNNTFLNTSVMNSATTAIKVAAPQNAFVNTVTLNNTVGLWLTASTTKVAEFFSTNNSNYAYQLAGTTGTVFSDDIGAFDNTLQNCYVTSSSDLTNNSCSASGMDGSALPSGGTLRLLSGVSASFGERVLVNDVENPVDANGSRPYANILAPEDWLKFDSWFRGWGKDGGVFPSTGNTGYCYTGTCKIWDWRVKTTGVLRNRHVAFTAMAACPALADGSVVITDYQSASNTFLKFASEVVGDYTGDEDGLCESNEKCIYSPNVGAYQGEGTLSNCTFSNGTVTGVTMQGYTTNGI